MALYGDGKPPTVAATITAETPLDALNLNWREKDLPQKQRTKHVHSLHPYLGKFVPQLAEIFLRKYFAPGQTVYDPFAGSGTTLVQANELGIHAVGTDISAFNVLLCTVKTQAYDLKRASEEINDILAQTQQQVNQQTPNFQDLPLFAAAHETEFTFKTGNDYLDTWYAPRALQELITYRNLIRSGGYQCTDLLKIILSRSARSARMTPHYDLDFPKQPQTEPYYCYKHSRTCMPVQEAYKFLKRYSRDTIRRLREFSKLRTDANVTIHHADSRTLDLPPINGVVTSPPYVGLIDYHQQHVYAYELLGLADRRIAEIGAAADGTSQRAKASYLDGIAGVFENALGAMPTGGRLIVVAGDKHDLYPDVAERLGVDVEAVVKRHVNRRTGRRSSEFYESVFIWHKQ